MPPNTPPSAEVVKNALIALEGADTGSTSFKQWQSGQTDVGNAEADDDQDGASNLLEYALGTDPHSGVQNQARFRLEAVSTIDAVLARPALTHNDLRYTLEGSSDRQQWRKLSTSSTSSYVGSDEVLRFANISGATVTGYVRVTIELDADLDGTAEATAITPVLAYNLQSLPTSKPRWPCRS